MCSAVLMPSTSPVSQVIYTPMDRTRRYIEPRMRGAKRNLCPRQVVRESARKSSDQVLQFARAVTKFRQGLSAMAASLGNCALAVPAYVRTRGRHIAVKDVLTGSAAQRQTWVSQPVPFQTRQSGIRDQLDDNVRCECSYLLFDLREEHHGRCGRRLREQSAEDDFETRGRFGVPLTKITESFVSRLTRGSTEALRYPGEVVSLPALTFIAEDSPCEIEV